MLTIQPGQIDVDSEFAEMCIAVYDDVTSVLEVEIGVRTWLATFPARVLIREGFAKRAEDLSTW